MLSHASGLSIPCGTFMLAEASPLAYPSEGTQYPFLVSTPFPEVNSFHCASVTFDFFKGLQYLPFPSITPWPVMAMSCRLVPLSGDWHLRVSSPSKEVLMSG